MYMMCRSVCRASTESLGDCEIHPVPTRTWYLLLQSEPSIPLVLNLAVDVH